MMTLFRRCLVIAALMFWQGGFTFYASVVVPIGRETLGGMRQASVTRQVAGWLNVIAAATLLLLAWDVLSVASCRRCRGATWLVMAVCQGLLFALLSYLDQKFDVETSEVLDSVLFRAGHRWYLWTSTIQWGFGVGFLVGTLAAWRRQDRGA